MRTPENRMAIAQLVLQDEAASEADLPRLIVLMDAISFAV